jgi:hypothetical protein
MLKRRAKANYEPGDTIAARDLNSAAKNANRSAALAGAAGAYSSVFEDFQGTMPPQGIRVIMVRAIRDILPEAYDEFSEVETTNDFTANAVKQIWDDQEGGYFDKEGDEVTVAALDVPILEDDVIPVFYSAASKRWVPLEERRNEMIEVASEERNDDGFFDGFICKWQNDEEKWLRTRAVHVIDGNDPTFPTEGP